MRGHEDSKVFGIPTSVLVGVGAHRFGKAYGQRLELINMYDVVDSEIRINRYVVEIRINRFIFTLLLHSISIFMKGYLCCLYLYLIIFALFIKCKRMVFFEVFGETIQIKGNRIFASLFQINL